MSDKQIKELKARANIAEHDLAQLQLERENWDSTKLSLKSEISSLKHNTETLEKKIRDLEFTVQKQGKIITELQNSNSDSNKGQQRELERLKVNLVEMESIVSYRAASSKKFLNKVLRLVNNFVQGNSEPGSQFKLNLKKFSREVVACVEEIGKVINSQGKGEAESEDFRETLREKDGIIEEYRGTLEKMREQMRVMREKLKDSDEGKVGDRKVRGLVAENEALVRKVRGLEESLREQSEFVSSLREVFGAQGEEVGVIDDELAQVDQEIHELQSSLSRALSH